MSIKGRFVEGELSTPTDSTREELRYTTVSPVGNGKIALDVSPKKYALKEKDFVIEGGDQTKIIKTNHGLKVGYMLRVKVTTNPWFYDEVSVMEVIDVNTVRLAAVHDGGFVVGDTFDVYKPVSERVADDGSSLATVISPPIRFFRDGVETPVLEDTATPANNTPLPVKLVGTGGDVNINVDGDINMHTSDIGTNFDSMRWGDGSGNYVGVTADKEALVSDLKNGLKLDAIETAVSGLATSGLATEATLVDTKVAVEGLLSYGIAKDSTLVSTNSKLDDIETINTSIRDNVTNVNTDLNANHLDLMDYLENVQEGHLNSINTKLTTAATEATLAFIYSILSDPSTASAPASDYASATVHDRLAKIAANITALSAKFAALGQNNSANSLSIVPANDASFPVTTAVPTTGTQSKGTLAMAASTTVNAPVGAIGFIIKNKASSEGTLHWEIGGTADANSFDLIPTTGTATVNCSANISLYASEGSVNYVVQWFH